MRTARKPLAVAVTGVAVKATAHSRVAWLTSGAWLLACLLATRWLVTDAGAQQGHRPLHRGGCDILCGGLAGRACPAGAAHRQVSRCCDDAHDVWRWRLCAEGGAHHAGGDIRCHGGCRRAARASRCQTGGCGRNIWCAHHALMSCSALTFGNTRQRRWRRSPTLGRSWSRRHWPARVRHSRHVKFWRRLHEWALMRRCLPHDADESSPSAQCRHRRLCRHPRCALLRREARRCCSSSATRRRRT